MAEQCVFCKEQIESTYPPRLEENKMFMFEILMEQTSFDKYLLLNSPMCEDCDKTILNFFNFKSNFMETEDEFINYMNDEKKVDLYDVLVKTYKVKKFENENVPIKVCRICFKVTQVEEYKEIKSLESKLAIMVTLCLPEVNIKLTNQTHLCTKCYSTILQYYHFLLLCIEATKWWKTDNTSQASSSFSKKISTSDDSDPSTTYQYIGSKDSDPVSRKTTCSEPSDPSSRKRTISEASRKEGGSEASDPLAVDTEEPQDKRQRFEEDTLSDLSEPLSPPSLLLPVDPPKRGRGRPRKGEEVTKSGTSRKNLQKQRLKKTDDSVRTRQDAAANSTMPSATSKAALKSTDMEVDVHSYECQICPEICYSLKDIQNHIAGHEEQKSFVCWRCGYEYFTLGALCTHYNSHDMGLFKIIRYKESSDDGSGYSKTDTSSTDHKAEAYDLLSVQRTNIYTPPELKKRRGRKRKVVVALETTSKKTSTSSSSSATSSTLTSSIRSTFKETLTNAVKPANTFRCEVCTEMFENMVELVAHFNTHAKQSLAICWICGAWFPRLELFKDHFKIHGLKKLCKGVPHNNQPSKDTKEQDVPFAGSSETRKKTPSPGPSSPIFCNECKLYFVQIDHYMNHPCTSKSREKYNLEESVKQREFGCGHCCAVFYSLDDLDDHNCISTKVVAKDGNVPLKTSENCDVNTVPTTHRPSPPQTEVLSKSTEPDYECSYCLLTFHTIKGLDKHTCKGDSEHTPPLKTSGPPVVKKETIFECSYCMSLFESSHEVAQHHCASMPASARTEVISTTTDVNSANTAVNSASTAVNSASTAVNPTSTDDAISADRVTDCMRQLIKSEPEYDSFLPPDSAIELGNEVYDDTQEKKVSSESFLSDIAKENSDDVSNSRNVDREKSIPDKAMSNEEKKQVINRIASMLGVRIVEGKEGSRDQDKNDKYDCMGCDFRGVDPRDLMIHVGYCDKLLRCSHCSFRTNILQELEIHSWLKHNILLFPCSNCTFITSMKENYLAHVKIHKQFKSDTDDTDNETTELIEENSQNDMSNDVLCISDEDDPPLDSAGNSLDRNSPGPEELLNRLFDFEKIRDDGLCVSKQATRVINAQKRYAMRPVSDNSSQADQQTATLNPDGSLKGLHSPASEETISAEATWPINSDDDPADPIAFHITRPEAQADINDITEDPTDDPLSTEPVWLVKSSSVTENIAQRQIANETSTLPDENYACQPTEDQIELIIPDRIIPEPKVKLEPSQDKKVTEETVNLQSEMPQEHCLESPKLQEIFKSSISQASPSRSSTNVTEPGETVCIQCDSDSDSEFVESSESLISSVAACTVEAVAISASEASKLISEGVLVINKSSLVAMQVESSPMSDEMASRPDTFDSAEHQSPTPLYLNPVNPLSSEADKLSLVRENNDNSAALADDKYMQSTTDDRHQEYTEDRCKESRADKGKKYAEEKGDEYTEDKNKESSADKDKEYAEEKDDEYTEDKNKEFSEDRHKECSADKDNESSNDKNKGSAEEKDKEYIKDINKESTEVKNKESTEDKNNESTEDRGKESSADKDKEYAEENDYEYTEDKESSEDRHKECSADKDNESANDKNKGSAEEKDKEYTKDINKESTEDKNKESSEDRHKESSADKDNESANDKNKGSAEEKDKEYTKDINKESAEDKSKESTDDKGKYSNESNIEIVPECNSLNTDSHQAEATKPLDKNEESLVKCNKETEAQNDRTSEEAIYSIPKDNENVSAKNKVKSRIIIETELEEKAADSDGSSVFVTDNENSDEEILISDDDDAGIKKEISKQIPAVLNVVDNNNSNVNVLQTTKNISPIFVSANPSSIPTGTEIEYPTKSSKNTPINKPSHLCAVNAEDSFVISDDEEEGAGISKGSNTGLNTATKTYKTGMDILTAEIESALKQNNLLRPQEAGSESAASQEISPIEYVRKIGSYQGLRVEAVKTLTAHAAHSGPSTKENNSLKTNVALAETTKISAAKPLWTYKKRASGNDYSIAKNKTALGKAAKNSTAPSSRTVGTNKDIQKSAVPKNTAGNSVQTTYVLIDDDDDDNDVKDKVNDDKSIAPRSRSESSLSSISLDRGFSQDTADETTKESDSGDDCVFISEVDEAESKNLRPPKSVPKRGKPVTGGVKRPPNALNLFISKVKREIQLKFPHLKWMQQKTIIWEAWKGMSDEDKFPFQEEARLHRVLFKREHPDLAFTNKKVIKDPLAVQELAINATDIEEIVLD